MNQALTVTEINQYIKNMFLKDRVLNRIYVKGEVSNCKYHTSGHIYFTLKDAQGQLACVMFAGQRKGLAFRMEEGQSVIILGSINVYERDGKYQLYASEIRLDGLGILYEKFEKLKKELAEEGLFNQAHKKPIPLYPQKVGIVTASTGAAIQDIINISKRRNPYVQLILYPALVQGAGAAQSVVKGINVLDKLGVDTIIIGRGGGSIEDLWAFNEEIVARAVYSCKTPIISAVGHETDITISDYVADLRAPTPSAAAELAVNDYMAYLTMLRDYQRNITKALGQKITLNQSKLKEFKLRLYYASPAYQIKQKRQFMMDIEQKLQNGMNRRLRDSRHRLELFIAKLEGLSPLSKLSKGYALVVGEDNKPIHSIGKVSKSQLLTISLLDGDILTRVEETKAIERDKGE
ncbi:exodeoxyribonuclease VII large subunit [Mobilitalea sibirica]|uniref:Exodeoxyribonuclease 7 large subunit n=1 Tax=Mobilitalea sibirica TaxID=1462919 RepID=A0A8J7KSD9_9FIRM|nr:exodeoxyribonuclease VII large subunit [Mobilitalea sibirica]MBH1940206.1 exodeoxyribonuclease VII large subunit [Mobilitalea sibirica]